MGRILLFASVFFLACAAGASPQSATKPSSKPPVTQLDSALVFHPVDQGGPLAERLERNTAQSLAGYLTANAFSIGHFEQVELNRFRCAILLGDVGLTCGLVAGAAGMAAGVWDEDSAWLVAGAAALAGALIGGTVKADDPKFRVQLRWVDDAREPAAR
jgi:hypothetical protein